MMSKTVLNLVVGALYWSFVLVLSILFFEITSLRKSQT